MFSYGTTAKMSVSKEACGRMDGSDPSQPSHAYEQTCSAPALVFGQRVRPCNTQD